MLRPFLSQDQRNVDGLLGTILTALNRRSRKSRRLIRDQKTVKTCVRTVEVIQELNTNNADIKFEFFGTKVGNQCGYLPSKPGKGSAIAMLP